MAFLKSYAYNIPALAATIEPAKSLVVLNTVAAQAVEVTIAVIQTQRQDAPGEGTAGISLMANTATQSCSCS
jgi:hypothetical protein